VPSNAQYTSSEIQNELISIAASKIRDDICRGTIDASIIAIMVDDAEDISGTEQMRTCLRYTHLPSLSVHEEFLMLKHMIDVDAKSLSEAIFFIFGSFGTW
jgi:Domain of unknown function (DUF4371)